MYANGSVSVDFLNNHQDIFTNTVPLEDFVHNVSNFEAIFYPGGHDPVFDLPENQISIQLIEEFYATEKVVSAVCHGPAVITNHFVGAKPLVHGKMVTASPTQRTSS